MAGLGAWLWDDARDVPLTRRRHTLPHSPGMSVMNGKLVCPAFRGVRLLDIMLLSR